MSKLIVLNNKMNLEYDQIYKYIDDLNKINTDNDIIVCPSNIYLETFINNCNWGIGCQNFYYEEKGNYTGEVSTIQLRSLGIEYSLVGHYERRKYFNETIEETRKKLEAALESNIIPILCFGENEEESNDTIIDQLEILLKNVSHIEFIIFAYEPNYCIGKNQILESEILEDRINSIYNYLYDKYSTTPRLIYGGGITESNVEEVLQNEKLSGIMLGSSSIEIDKINKIISRK